VTPEALDGGALAHIRDGDIIHLDAEAGILEVRVPEAELFARPAAAPTRASGYGFGRELFGHMRKAVGPAEAGASVLF
jgi:phosphogluconate dehydratase